MSPLRPAKHATPGPVRDPGGLQRAACLQRCAKYVTSVKCKESEVPHLREDLEEAAHLALADADARVTDREVQHVRQGGCAGGNGQHSAACSFCPHAMPV